MIMKKKDKSKIRNEDLPKIRIPLPKQRCQAFADITKYNRKREKGSRKDPFYFAMIVDIVQVL